MKKTMRRFAAEVLAVVMVCCLLTGCSFGKVELPETTSADLDIYRLDGRFVDCEGVELLKEDGTPVYRLNKDGHLVTDGEKKDVIVIAAENISDFTCVTSVSIDEKDRVQKIPVYVLQDGSTVYDTASWTVAVVAEPENTVNGSFKVVSSDPNTVKLDDGDGVVFENGGELKVTALYSGSSVLMFTNCLGETIGAVEITVTAEESTDADAIAAAEERIANCDHEYEAEIIEPTETSEGYTQHTCKKCGHIYRDTYTDKLPCTHTFTERIINATCTEQGYTLCTCTKCGYTEQKDFTPLAEHTYEDEVVPATCAKQGYTEHTCTVCGYVERDTFTPLVDHKYADTKVAPTCTQQGYTVHRCTVCGHNYQDDFIPMIAHTFLVSTVAPTYREQGYTLHSCNVCGYSFKDSYVPKLVCTVPTYVQTSHTEPTCTKAGSTVYTCSRCGQTRTDPIAALGHSYTDTVTAPDCTHGGHTVHICSVCHYQYTDTEVPALGHDWQPVEYQYLLRQESHSICAGCGMDLTAAGFSSGDIYEHTKAHALNGEPSNTYSRLVPIYETRIKQVCSRCGAEVK